MLKIIIPNKESYCYNLHYHTNTDPPSIDLEVGGAHQETRTCGSSAIGPPS